MSKVLLVDHYDSFTYNLYQQLASLGAEVHVVQHDQVFLLDIEAFSFDRIVLSPGPGRPEEAVISPRLVEKYKERCPILGVCLGMQVIGKVFGVETIYAREVKHGKTSPVHHTDKDLFQEMENPFEAARYHSLVLSGVPLGFRRTAWTEDGVIMSIKHETLPLFGVQFHPESFLTKEGDKIMSNFLNL